MLRNIRGFEAGNVNRMIVRSDNGHSFACQRIELVHQASKRRIEVLYLAIDAVKVFEAIEHAKKRIRVFVHRADSTGEGGSNLWWLHPHPGLDDAPGFLDRVLAIVEEDGLIVSDGSNAAKGFCTVNYGSSEPNADPTPFTAERWQLTPIRTVAPRTNPTWIWQVRAKGG
jgi:hypothetical protein